MFLSYLATGVVCVSVGFLAGMWFSGVARRWALESKAPVLEDPEDDTI
jgi:hypothetical protein